MKATQWTTCPFLCLAVTGCFLLSGCGIPSLNLDTVTIDGVTYRSGFYEPYYWVHQAELDQTEQKAGLSTYRKVLSSQFDLYQTNSFSGKTGGDLYCTEAQWDDAYAFYHDGSNYSYEVCIGSHVFSDDTPTAAFTSAELPYETFTLLLQGEDFSLSMNWLDWVKDTNDTLALPYDAKKTGVDLAIRACSCDNLLVSMEQKLFFYQNQLYYFDGMDGNYNPKTDVDGEDIYYYTPVPKEANTSLCHLLRDALTEYTP